jgi:hypothetical protein
MGKVKVEKIWEVEASGTMYVTADDDMEATDIAEQALRDNRWDCGIEFDATECTSIDHVDHDWRDAIPFGGADGDERTVDQRFHVIARAKAKAAKQEAKRTRCKHCGEVL